MENKRIIFEGFDRSGKSHFSEKLFNAKYLKTKTILLSEPYSNKNSFHINSRDIINKYIKHTEGISEELRNILYILDRTVLYQAIENLSKCSESIVYISDRSFISNVAIQSANGVDDIENLLQTNIDLIKEYNIPTNIIFYMNRDNEMNSLKETNDDTLTDMLIEYKYKIKANYEWLLRDKNLLNYPTFKDTKIFIIDNNKDEQTILDELINLTRENIYN